ncbi:unnamed protein product [Auanema sp. JU1783]|nr:unnamed protein product [Auanema sp. JU1783]
MAELIDVGKHCELDSCKRLDYTPFNCHLCSKSFCQDHRLNHGCSVSKVYEGPSEGTSFDPVRPYLCSYEKCPNAESVKITCRLCLLNFCLKHRHEDEHSCTHMPKDPKEEVEKKMAAIREACGVKEEEKPQANTKPKKVLKLTEAQKARMDKVSLMKLKLNNKLQLGPNESLIVFVEWSDGREPIMISKSWTIGRAISSFVEKHTEFSGTLSVHHIGNDKQLDYSETCGHVLKEHETIYIERK